MRAAVALKGEVDRIIFQKEDYVVFRFKTPRETIKCVGNVYLSHGEGENLEVTGEWTDSQKSGKQSAVLSWNNPIQIDKESIVSFLKLLKGIDPKLAKRIVDVLGDDAIRLILDRGEAVLSSIPKIGEVKAKTISEQVKQHVELQVILTKLIALGLSSNIEIKAYKHFKERAVQEIQRNPWLFFRF